MSAPVEGWLLRLREEAADIQAKTKKLNAYLDSRAFAALHGVDQVDLERQYAIMVRYQAVLVRRLNRAEINNASGIGA